MKETLLSILQQQMDKCTTEQFWAVGSLTAVDAFFITQRNDLASAPTWLWMTVLTIGMIYGVWFILHRHISFYRFHRTRAKLLEGEPNAPDAMTEAPNFWRFEELSGVTFFIIWVVFGYVLCWFAA